MNKYLIVLTCLLLTTSCIAQEMDTHTGSFKMILKDNWQMQSVLKDPSPGKTIAQNDFIPKDWYKISVPSTIIAGLLANNVYDFDPFFGQNFEKLKDPKLDKPWWFRKVFSLPKSEEGKNVILRLHGINYKANVWLNGKLIADEDAIKGPMRIIELDITDQILYNNKNVLAIEITRPFNPNRKDGDLAIDYADWIHYPPDYNGGIVNNVEINTYRQVGIQYPLVTTKFDLPSLKVAHLSVDALVTNYTDKEQEVMVKGVINTAVKFEQKVHLQPNERKNVRFSSNSYRQLNIENPRIWWPWQYGKQEMNKLKISVVQQHHINSAISEDFGIRQITSELINNQSRVFIVNGKRIMVRGAAWSPDIFQRRSAKRQEEELRLYRDMHLNVVRSEGKFEDDHFYALCDKYGLLVMTGWMCCGAWQYPENWTKAERAVAMASDSSMMYWLRNKASIMVWLNGSDMPPKDVSVEKDYLDIEKALNWPNPILATANEQKSKVSGYSGVKMAGPYEWVPPIYWETDSDSKYGGMWSFATEISPGPSIPPYESLIKFIPKESLWYTSSDWKYHCGTMKFGNTDVFNEAIINRYGKPDDIRNYIAKAQAQNYEAHRAMMEAYGLHKYNTATGVIQWMGSNPWPGLIWHTYDYYLNPAGTYFGIKKALEPLHIMYAYGSSEVAITNSLLHSFQNLRATATIYNKDGKQMYTNTITTSVEADGTQKCFDLPEVDNLSDSYFLRLQLDDSHGKVVSINWYWLSRKKDKLDWAKSNWWMTPQSAYADYSSLQYLKKTSLAVTIRSHKSSDSTLHHLTVKNTGSTVAFQVHIRAISKQSGDDILPVIFSDNYLELAPGESRVITCSYADQDRKGSHTDFEVSAWNLEIAGSKKEGSVVFKEGL